MVDVEMELRVVAGLVEQARKAIPLAGWRDWHADGNRSRQHHP